MTVRLETRLPLGFTQTLYFKMLRCQLEFIWHLLKFPMPWSKSGETLYTKVQVTWSRLLTHSTAAKGDENLGFIVGCWGLKKAACMRWLSFSHHALFSLGSREFQKAACSGFILQSHVTYGLKLRRGIPRDTGTVLRLSFPVLPRTSSTLCGYPWELQSRAHQPEATSGAFLHQQHLT